MAKVDLSWESFQTLPERFSFVLYVPRGNFVKKAYYLDHLFEFKTNVSVTEFETFIRNRGGEPIPVDNIST